MKFNVFNCDSTTVVFASDFHVGNKYTDKDALNRMINDVRKNDYHLMVLGDLCECITAKDKRFNMGMVDSEFLDDDMIGRQYDYVEKLLNPVADRILTIHCGNHDESISKYCHIDMVKDLCKNLEVPYSYYMALSNLVYKKPGKKTFTYTIFTEHGSGGGGMRGSRVNSMEKLSGYIRFDAAFRGHSHDLLDNVSKEISMSRYGNMCSRNIYTGSTGSFLSGVMEGDGVSYPERAGYRPLPIGYLRVKFNPKEYGIKIDKVVM